MKNKNSYIYIATNSTNRVLYTGVTSDLVRRMYQHKSKNVSGFTTQYHVDKLVYFEVFDDIENAITREKQIKAGSRRKKIELIHSQNPDFSDLYSKIL